MRFCWDQLLRAIKTLASNILEYLKTFLSVFNKSTAEQLPEGKPWDHAINLEAGFKPQQGKVYPLSPAKLKELDTFIEENLRKGYIRPSKSPMASPFFFVNKKSGDLRPCQDYRKLNNATIKNAYPIPRVEDLLDRIASAKPTIFTKLDLRAGYNNVRIKEVNPPITAEEQHPTPVPAEPSPDPPRSTVDPVPEEEPTDRHPNNPEDGDPEPSDQEDEEDMSDNNSGAVNKPNQFEGDKGKSKEFLDELYLYFEGNSKKIQTDKDKVQCTLSYIKGPAQFFVHTVITDAQDLISDTKNAPLKGLPVKGPNN
ncbi:uncharacterized protein FIBRA_09492 [Fibroporia radiculosa]|uniref:Reverse transcriptase domain-containing protein n=1 Tax=Fibroporia radiculosa TaxID=599839 RepID=J7S6K8_9APHY|nr:uncharacterized protein FIBRA_09492 [Fibroporia radiculosa]CCM07154.1 predicted protein [Fibroporia radiculosa]